MILLTLALLFQPPQPQNDQLARVAHNPTELARFIDTHLGFDWNVLWKALGTKGEFIQPCGKLSDGLQRCSTELITVLNPDQQIVLVKGDWTPDDVYIRYLKTRNGIWRFSGVRTAYIHNFPRRHEIDRSTGTPYLRVSSQGVSGSDVGSEEETWYDLSQERFEPVFSFPVSGHEHRLGLGISRSIVSTIIPSQQEIDVDLQVTFSGEDGIDNYSVGIIECVGVFARPAPGKPFELQAAYSDASRRAKMSNSAFKSLAAIGGASPTNEELINLDVNGLIEIAMGESGVAKNWLRELLNHSQNTSEVQKLKALLQ